MAGGISVVITGDAVASAASPPSAGVGALTAVPASTPNGAPLGTPPSGARGVRLYLPTGSSVTYTIAPQAPTAPPAATFTVSASTGPNWDEDLSAGQMLWVVALTGAPLFRWY